MTGLKKFISNKNTVTIIGVLLGVIVMYIGYNMRISKEINPIEVPYAKETISPGTKITEDLVGTIEVPPAMLKGEAFQNSSDVIGKYANADSVIPEGSLFYARAVVSKEDLPDSIILDYPDGYVLYNLAVNMETTYGNSIYPGNYIDIYLKAVNGAEDAEATQKDKIMLGKLFENVKVLAVKDSDGNNVFENLDEKTTPSQIIFALPADDYVLLRKASYLRTYETTIIPVPTAESLKDEPGDIAVSNEKLKKFINDVTVWTEDTGTE